MLTRPYVTTRHQTLPRPRGSQKTTDTTLQTNQCTPTRISVLPHPLTLGNRILTWLRIR